MTQQIIADRARWGLAKVVESLVLEIERSYSIK